MDAHDTPREPPRGTQDRPTPGKNNEANEATRTTDAPTTSKRDRLMHRVGYGAFLLFALTLFWGPAGPYLMLLPLLAYFVYWCRQNDAPAPRSPLVWLAWIYL